MQLHSHYRRGNLNRVRQALYDVIELDLDTYFMAHSFPGPLKDKVRNKHGIFHCVPHKCDNYSSDNNITIGKIYREVIKKEASRFYVSRVTAKGCLPLKHCANRSVRHWRHTGLNRMRGEDHGG